MNQIYMHTTDKYKEGTQRWIKWCWENNPHLSAGQKLCGLLTKVTYWKIIETAVKYNLSLKDKETK